MTDMSKNEQKVDMNNFVEVATLITHLYSSVKVHELIESHNFAPKILIKVDTTRYCSLYCLVRYTTCTLQLTDVARQLLL